MFYFILPLCLVQFWQEIFMPSLDVPVILIAVFLLGKLAWAIYIRTHPEANTPRYDFETW